MHTNSLWLIFLLTLALFLSEYVGALSFKNTVAAANPLTAHVKATVDTLSRPGKVLTLPPQTTDLSVRFNHLQPIVTSSNLVAYWPFDEGSGYEFSDSSGNQHTAYITGSRWNTFDSGLSNSFHRNGKRAGCVYLNGTQWIEAQDASDLQHQSQITISAWLKPERHPSEMIGQAIIGKASNSRGYTLSLSRENSLRFVIFYGNGREHAVESRSNTLAEGRWTHVTATSDAATGQSRIYINGDLSGSANDAPFVARPSAANLLIGRSDLQRAAFKGWIDEVSIHKRVLDDKEVHKLYAIGFPKIYRQTRETIDSDQRIWTQYHGNQFIPHPIEPDTIFYASYNGTLASHRGVMPSGFTDADDLYVPASFGSAYDAVKNRSGLTYESPIQTQRGTVEIWFVPAYDPFDPSRNRKKTIFRAAGEDVSLELFSMNRKWFGAFGVSKGRRRSVVPIASKPQQFAYDEPVHLALTWDYRKGDVHLTLYINGVDVARNDIKLGRRIAPQDEMAILNRDMDIGGRGDETAYGYVDDLRISSDVRSWGTICPSGHVETESAALDLVDGFDHRAGEALMWWRPGVDDPAWNHSLKTWEDDGATLGDSGESRRALKQNNDKNFHALFHPNAYGQMSSIEAGVSFDAIKGGWAGVFIQSPASSSTSFTGYTFAVNARTPGMRIAVYSGGRIVAAKALPYDFAVAPHKTYTLTLTSINDGVLRGYINGQNLISMTTSRRANNKGFAGLFTDNAAAYFDDLQFTALTPSQSASRQIQVRLFSDGSALGTIPDYEDLTLSAFRWKKRQGLLPWQRTYKNPQPPGAIFGADDGIQRPNPSQGWRAEDSANSALIKVDGDIYYFMRGNPIVNELHGPAHIGVLTTSFDKFDGIHFLDRNEVINGHAENAPAQCRDNGARREQLQINDEGVAYFGGKIILVAREFRNPIKGFPWFRRLVYGSYDPARKAWDWPVVNTVSWSAQSNPADCNSTFSGIDATPELASLRDPLTDQYVLFLFYTQKELPRMIGLIYDGATLELNSDYPARDTFQDYQGEVVYGQRILFDNGIYYMNYNAGSIPDKLRRDWPDRFKLASSLHPYSQPWIQSADNTNATRPYFTRGAANDFDNGAIWHGAMLKHRNKYYMYYENYHSIEDVDKPYEEYDHIQTGSRVGYATAN